MYFEVPVVNVSPSHGASKLDIYRLDESSSLLLGIAEQNRGASSMNTSDSKFLRSAEERSSVGVGF